MFSIMFSEKTPGYDFSSLLSQSLGEQSVVVEARINTRDRTCRVQCAVIDEPDEKKAALGFFLGGKYNYFKKRYGELFPVVGRYGIRSIMVIKQILATELLPLVDCGDLDEVSFSHAAPHLKKPWAFMERIGFRREGEDYVYREKRR